MLKITRRHFLAVLGHFFVRKCLQVKPSNDNTTRGIYSLASDASSLFWCSYLESKGFGTMANSPPADFPINIDENSLVSTTAIRIILPSQIWYSNNVSLPYAKFPLCLLPVNWSPVCGASERPLQFNANVSGFWLTICPEAQVTQLAATILESLVLIYALASTFNPPDCGLVTATAPNIVQYAWQTRTCWYIEMLDRPHYSKSIYMKRSFTQHREYARLTSRMQVM